MKNRSLNEDRDSDDDTYEPPAVKRRMNLYYTDGSKAVTPETMRRRRKQWYLRAHGTELHTKADDETCEKGTEGPKEGTQTPAPTPSGSRGIVQEKDTSFDDYLFGRVESHDHGEHNQSPASTPSGSHSILELNTSFDDYLFGRVESHDHGEHNQSPASTPSGSHSILELDTSFDDYLFGRVESHDHGSEASSDAVFPSDHIICNDGEVPTNDCESAADDLSPTVTPTSPTASNTAEDLTEPNFEGFNIDKVKDFIANGGDAVMFKESNLATWQVVLIILGLCNRYSLSITGRRSLIEASRLFAGSAFASWDISDYEIAQVFDPPDEVLKYQFYCEVCFKEVGESTTKRQFVNHEVVCERCLEKYELSMSSPNYFVHLDLRYQITSFLRLPIIRKGLSENLKHVTSRVGVVDGTITDVYDSLLYKKLFSQMDENSRLLTYVFNTDGAPLFNSSKRGFWPIQLIINELPRKIRFKYPLLVGLAITKKEPPPDFMNTYLKSFVQEANKLSTEGFEMKIDEGNVVRFVLKPLACSVDSVARPILQNRLQFNGYHGCSWCYSMGEHSGGCIRFLMEENDPPDRTHEDYVEDCKAVMKKVGSAFSKKKKKTNIRGVKGDSILRELKGLDMIWAFVRDYLHADSLGVVSQMMNMLSDTECPIRLTKNQFAEVNERLMGMTPPHEVHRLVRPLISEKAKWKASEWRSWLLFYAIPCLSGILDHYALQHFALLVRSIYKLLESSITEDDLQKVDYDLERFVIIFELLYGERYVTFNVHSLKHLVRCVRSCGPLWATSTFPFEGAIPNLKRFVHGAKGVYEQMAKKALQGNILHNLVEEMEDSPACYAFHKSLFGYYEVASFRRSRQGVVLIGRGARYHNEDDPFGCKNDEGDVLKFQRCIKSGTVVSSIAYKRQKKSNDTMFRDKRGVFVQVLYLLCHNNTAFAKVSCFESRNVVVPNEKEGRASFEDRCTVVMEDLIIDHLFVIDEKECYTSVIPVVDLLEKCVLIKISGKTYVSRLPNAIEIQ